MFLNNDDLIKTGEQVVKKRGRGGKENFPSVISSDNTKAEDIKRIMKDCLRWSGELVTVEKLCLALGYSRTTVFDWENGRHCSPERSNMIKKAKELISTTDSILVSEGKINPVVYIFRAKNYFGMKDQQDIVVKPDNPLGDYQSPEELQKRIDASVVED